MASTFCFDRDMASAHEWLGGRIMACSENPPHTQAEDLPAEPDYPEIGYDGQKRSFDFDWYRAKSSRKSMTLRSYRDPRSIGGSDGKGAVRKLLRRLREKKLVFIQPTSMSHAYMMG